MRRSSGSWDETPVQCPPPFNDTRYIRCFAVCFEKTRFTNLSIGVTALVVPYRLDVRDKAADDFQKTERTEAVGVLPPSRLFAPNYLCLLSSAGKRVSIGVYWPVCRVICTVGGSLQLLLQQICGYFQRIWRGYTFYQGFCN